MALLLSLYNCYYDYHIVHANAMILEERMIDSGNTRGGMAPTMATRARGGTVGTWGRLGAVGSKGGRERSDEVSGDLNNIVRWV